MKKVLIVEDDEFQHRLIKGMVDLWGFVTICFENGAQAWQFLEINSDLDLLITDMQMPEMPGRELIERIRKQ